MGNTVLLSHLQALRSTIGYHYHSSAILSCQVGLKLPQMASWHEACFLFDILVQLIAFLNITPYFSETLLGGVVIFFLLLWKAQELMSRSMREEFGADRILDTCV